MWYALQDEPEKGKRLLTLAVGMVVAVGLQGGGFMAATYYQPSGGLKKSAVSVVQITTVVPKPKPKPEPKPEPPKPEPPKPEPKPEPPKPKPKPKPKKRKPKPKKKKPKPKVAPKPKPKAPSEKPPPKKPTPVKTGISLTSTDARGRGVTMQAGNTQMGEVGREAVAPVTGRPTPGETVVEAPAPAPKRPPVRKKAKVKRKVRPQYTRAALRAGVEGQVVVVVSIAKDGTVKKVRLIKGLGYGLDELAVAAVKRWTFSPATVDGEPIKSTKRIKVEFVIED